ncbi:hypothetical protein GOP47_0025851 [Adiantum capillus-veneris]|uniref:Sde2 N-terminal ubiquitin domain-containing protein n=1 Tax=Adiantum capillus-veneris TaxID=13818 RepID=A0A9D4U1P3_ADICA|nr:hypothetical protein GOP47_0025851 [Adiantum capillus-veneris]
MAITCQLLLRGLDGRTSCLRFPSTIITGSLIQDQIATILRFPAEAFLILTGTTLVHQHSSLCASSDGFFPSCSLVGRLRGGKGGFGSLLRGAATKAGQKKTSNYDACRDMSGRRLRHVNAEKKLKEWKAQAKERELEKTANEFLKKQAKRKEDDSGCSEVIEKFQVETSRAREEVESAVASGLKEAKRLGKRKVLDDNPLPASSSKRAQIWFDGNMDISEDGLEDETDSSDDDDDAEVSEGEDAKDDADGGLEAVKGLENGKCNEDSDVVEVEEVGLMGCEEGKLEEVENGKAEEGFEAKFTYERSVMLSEEVEAENKSECMKGEEWLGEHHGTSKTTAHVEKNVCMVEIADAPSLHGGAEENKSEGQGTDTLTDSGGNGQSGAANDGKQTLDFLNLEDFLHASDLEVLGLDQLKHELQLRGLKCGGSLSERAGRLFLLKTIPLEKLDKKHFAKGRG